jgi:ABC-type tungstate transport system permease subunit
MNRHLPRSGNTCYALSITSSPTGQKVIENYKIDGQQLFFPNTNNPAA